MRSVFYNDFEPFAAAWLAELQAEGAIGAGDISTTSIKELTGHDIAGYQRAHFFAGIGGWDAALAIAGWPDDRPVWTGSCPCQPFSAAGKRAGTDDPRHLWPDFARLIGECRPPVIFGEQVASADGRAWLAGVRADLEALGYAVGAADLCSAGIGAPHIRQRLYWVAQRLDDAASARHQSARRGQPGKPKRGRGVFGVGCEDGGMASTDRGQCSGLADGEGRERNGAETGRQQGDSQLESRFNASGHGRFGGDPRRTWQLVACRDGRIRRTPAEPAIFPLADGVPNRVGTLRGAGNSIDPFLAAEFVTAFMETEQ